MQLTETEAHIFHYLTTYRATINLAGIATKVGTSRSALTEFLDGKRRLSEKVQQNFSLYFQELATMLAAF